MLLKVYLEQFLSPGTSCPAINEQLQGIPKNKQTINPTKTIQFEEAGQATELDIAEWRCFRR